MQVWTEQMHQKTLSMHLITIFTLIFLPGTFVAVRSLSKTPFLLERSANVVGAADYVQQWHYRLWKRRRWRVRA
jgi:hypothetical protein